MKRHLLWTFDRGSFQWDIMCLVILAFLFLIPRHFFQDVPDFMKVSATEFVHKTVDKNGNTIFTVKLDTPRFLDTYELREATTGTLVANLGTQVHTNLKNMQPIRDWTGRVIGYAIWRNREQ
jgi:hypothetical protein